MATRSFQRSFRVCTPMFCGGANQDSSEVRMQSIKGMIRFWWRTLMANQCENVEEMHEKEAKLFGSSDSDIGQSKLRIRIANENKVKPSTDRWNPNQRPGAIYLGYGVTSIKGDLNRPMLADKEFDLACRVRDTSDSVDNSVQQITDAIDLWSCAGALGAKSRKGFGSVCLTGEHAVSNPQAVIEKLMTRYGTRNCQSPEWTAWSADSRVVFIQSNDTDAMNLLDKIGRELLLFRGWGFSTPRNPEHAVWAGQPSEQNFFYDHELSKGKRTPIAHPQRVAFGLPHNYGTGEVKPTSHERRGSPLFIHIHQPDPKTKPTAVLTFLPSRFLPGNEGITAFTKRVPVADAPGLWDPIHAFLDRLTHGGKKPHECHAGYADFGKRPRDDGEDDAKPWWVRKHEDLKSVGESHD